MYKLYLIDYDGTSIELDTEEIDFGVELQISTLNDLSLRTGNRTKEITLKGTSRNNNAFGYIYRLGRSSDVTLNNKLFFNYNSLRQVDCLIYKYSNLLFRGTLRLLETVRIKGVIYYHVVITDAVIDVMKYTQEKLLTDLDLTDLNHIYTQDNIVNSWDTNTQRWNGSTYSYEPFEYGSGYVYGYAYYGLTPSPTSVKDNIYNYRPAVYTNEIFDRIFSQSGLTGYSWELRASAGITDRFNRLVVPNNQETLAAKSSNFKEVVYTGTYSNGTNWVGNNVSVAGDPIFNVIPFSYTTINTPIITLTGSNTSIPILRLSGSQKAVHDVVSTINVDAYLSVYFVFDASPGDSNLTFEVVERTATTAEYGAWGSWVSVGGIGTWYPITTGLTSGTVNAYIPKREWDNTKQIAVRALINGEAYFSLLTASASLTIPFTTSGDITINIPYDQVVTPQLPENVKQYDFLKSTMLMFNLFAYTEKERPKHIIFQQYDEFYALTQPDYIKTTAIDWTKKVVYDSDMKKVFNLTIPKSYLYTYKEDKDYINTNYKDQFNAIYGQLKFNDLYGVTDEKKVELIFSPTPDTYFNGKYAPTIRGGDDTTLRPVASNIRMIYYNGAKAVSPYYMTYGTYSTSNITQYGEMSEYYRPGTSSLAIDALQFGLPRKVYFPVSSYYTTLPNLYSRYHIGQVTELTSENLYTIECKMHLTDLDISRFDFRTPVYIQTDIGNSYYKVLSVSWKDDSTPATVKLQSINFDSFAESQTTTTTSTTTTTTTTSPYVQNTIVNITDTGWFKYNDSLGNTIYQYASSVGSFNITDCHDCGSIRTGFPYADLANWSSITCGTSC